MDRGSFYIVQKCEKVRFNWESHLVRFQTLGISQMNFCLLSTNIQETISGFIFYVRNIKTKKRLSRQYPKSQYSYSLLIDASEIYLLHNCLGLMLKWSPISFGPLTFLAPEKFGLRNDIYVWTKFLGDHFRTSPAQCLINQATQPFHMPIGK